MYCTTLGDLGETAGPRIDRIQPARPPWWDRQFRELKKLIFSPPSKCLIDLFGPLANRTALKRLHAAIRFLLASVLPAASSCFGGALGAPVGHRERGLTRLEAL